MSQYPGWFNFPVDLVVGGAGQDQVEKHGHKQQRKQQQKQTRQDKTTTFGETGLVRIRIRISRDHALLLTNVDVKILATRIGLFLVIEFKL